MDAKQLVTVEEAASVLSFWFDELDSTQWFKKDHGLDTLIRSRFGQVHSAAANGELWPWRATAQGRLAEIIILDQFSRNIYRESPQAFACDTMALVLAQEAISIQADFMLSTEQKAFLYMPFMHSESLDVHDVAMELFNTEGLEKTLDFEVKHRNIIARFGRYPHRNKVLGRSSTPEEARFLAQPGSSF